MCLAKQEDNIELAIKLYHLIVDGMKQRLGNVLHTKLSEKVALASLYRIHRFAQSVGNIIHRVTLCRQSQYFSLSLAQGYAFFLFPLVAQGGIFKTEKSSLTANLPSVWLSRAHTYKFLQPKVSKYHSWVFCLYKSLNIRII